MHIRYRFARATMDPTVSERDAQVARTVWYFHLETCEQCRAAEKWRLEDDEADEQSQSA